LISSLATVPLIGTIQLSDRDGGLLLFL